MQDYMIDNGQQTRRRKGEGSWQSARKKAKSSGKAYTKKEKKQVDAKKPPSENVSCGSVVILLIPHLVN